MTECSEDSGVKQTQAVAKDTGPPGRPHGGSIVAHAADLANAFTLGGLFCAVVGIYFAARGVFSAAVIALLWAIFFDWFDGPGRPRDNGASL